MPQNSDVKYERQNLLDKFMALLSKYKGINR